MTATKTRYAGATTCGLQPEWDPALAADNTTRALLTACHAAHPDNLTPQLILADLLGEQGDPREQWVRAGCSLWEQCWSLTPANEPWDYGQTRTALTPVAASLSGWRLTSLWGCLVGWHCPAGDESGPMGKTWADKRVRVVSRLCWWWALGLLGNQAYAARSQAEAAGSQADAARSQAEAAGSQASAAWRQALAAWNQASAAGSQALAAWNQALAAWNQADAAGNQALAAGDQASAAWRQALAAGDQASAAGSQALAAGKQSLVWRFARATWGIVYPLATTLGH